MSEKLIFSGHETFHCKNLWLKKGYDFVVNNGKFTDDASVELGVGRNMVSSIRFWLKAFNISDSNQEITTDIADFLFNELNGRDKYLEDEATLWLLHYYLVTNKYASIYSIIFNDFRKLKPEFDANNLSSFISENGINVNPNTLKKDYSVFLRTYYAKNNNDKEDSFSGVLSDLNLIHVLKNDENIKYFIQNTKQNQIPKEFILFIILENENYGDSISFQSLYSEYNSIGNVFGLSKDGLETILLELSESYDFINYSNTAGIKELQFNNKPNSLDILNAYYEEN